MDLKERLAQAKIDRDGIQKNIDKLKKEINDRKKPKPKHGDIFKFMGGGHDYILIKSEYLKGGDFLVAWKNSTYVYSQSNVEKYCNDGTWVVVGNVLDN